MAQSSAAREPTMEEILASIRRIIESNDGESGGENQDDGTGDVRERPALTSLDGGRGAVDDSGEGMDDFAEDEALAIAPERPLAPQSGRLEGTTIAAVTRPANDQIPARAISLADVAARLRGTMQSVRRPESDEAGASAAAMPPEPEAVPAAPQALPLATAVPGGETNPRPELPDEQDDAVVDCAAEPDVAPPAEALAAEPQTEAALVGSEREPVAVETMRHAPIAVTPPIAAAAKPSAPAQEDRAGVEEPEPARNGSVLISSSAGAKVAAAFEDLNEAVAKGQMRSLDEIAKEMLAPMLRDWLDDNLPTLVERLVREEIERVARGGRR